MRVDEGADDRACATPQGEVRAAAVVLATNAYTPPLGYFRRGILPLHSHVVATGAAAGTPLAALGWSGPDGFTDDLDRIAYGCRTPGGRLLFGGGGNRAYTYRFGGAPVFASPRGRRAARTSTRSSAACAATSPALADEPIAHRWSGPLAITFDRVCSMGVTRRAPQRLLRARLQRSRPRARAARRRVLADLYSGDHDAWRDLPFYQKRLPPIPPEPLRWLGYQVYTRLTGRSPRRR